VITTVSNTDGLWTALKNAHAGDTILLAAGTYSALSLTGFNFAGTVTVQSADPTHQAVINGLTLTSSSGISFNHIDFASNGGTAVTLYSSQNIAFDATKIHGASLGDGSGMMIRDSSGVSVTNSDIGKLGTGINELNSSNLTVSNNVFHDIQSGAIRGTGDTVETTSGNQFVDAKATVTDHSDVIQLWQDNTANHVTIATNNTYGVVASAPVVTTPVVTAPVVTAPVVTAPVVTTPVATTPVVTTQPVTTSPTAPAGAVTVTNSAQLVNALKHAHAGDTILLAAGTYSNVALSNLNFKTNVTLQSADPTNQAVITGLTLTNDTGLSFNHIDFASNGGTAVTMYSSQNISFDATKFHGASLGDGSGMMIRDSSGVSVTNSDIGKLGTGINELNSTKLTISNDVFHEIQNGAIRGTGDTVETISGNQFVDAKATVTDHSDVIQLWQDNTANHVTIANNTYGATTTTPVVTTPPPTTPVVTTPPPTTTTTPPPTTTTTTPPPTTTTTSGAGHTVTVTNAADLMTALNSAHAGDTINLAAGNYGTVSLYGLHFNGTVTIQSADNANEAVINSLTVQSSSGISFSHVDLAMTGGGYGAYVLSSQNIAFDSFTAQGTPDSTGAAQGVAFFARASSGVSVTNSEISQVGVGIVDLDSDHLTFANNYIHDVQSDGIDNAGSSNVVIAGNRFTNFHPVDGDHPDAIQFWAGSNGTAGNNITVADNVITRGNGDVMQGIFVEATQNISITGNAMAGTMYNGISVSTTTNALIQNNFVQGYNDMGSRIIARDASANVTVTGNTISEPVVNLQVSTEPNVTNFVLGTNTLISTSAIGDTSALNNWVTQTGGSVLVGTAGNDILTGTSGNNLFVAVGGLDTMTGGGGNDVFSFQALPSGVDQITDFVHGQDTLDLHALLNNYTGSNPVADQWVKFTSDSTGTTVYVDSDGPSGSASFTAVAKLVGVTSITSSDWIFH
jgi:Right handed beta helix region